MIPLHATGVMHTTGVIASLHVHTGTVLIMLIQLHSLKLVGFVWDRKMASKLVLTVLKGLPIPQVIFHGKEVKDESGDTVAKLDVIDGKQRLTSLLAFVMSDNMGWKEAPVTLDLLVKNSGDGGPGQYAWYHGKKFTDLKRMQQKTVLDSLISILTIGKETETK